MNRKRVGLASDNIKCAAIDMINLDRIIKW